MEDLKKLIEKLHTQPVILKLAANNYGGAAGVLSIPKDGQDIVFTYVRDTSEGFTADAFTSSTAFGHFFIKLQGMHTTSGEFLGKLKGQHQPTYDYILFSNSDEIVTEEKFDKVTFRYDTFIDGVPVSEDEPGWVSLFEHVKRCKKTTKDFKLDVRLSSHQKWQNFPRKRITSYDKINFVFDFKKAKTVNEVRALLHELNNYLALFLQAPIKPTDVVLHLNKETKKWQFPYCFLIEKDLLSNAPKAIDPKSAISFNRQGYVFLKNLVNAIQYQDRFYVPLNIIRGYWVYKEKKVYLDSQVSALLSAIEAIYELINAPSDRQKKRERDYETFINKIEDLELPKDLIKWLNGRSTDYTERKPFSEKVKTVVELAGGDITNQKAETLNRLRNDLMHGRFPDWNEYLSNHFEQRTREEGDKVNLKWLEWVVSSAVLKLIGRGNDLPRSKK